MVHRQGCFPLFLKNGVFQWLTYVKKEAIIFTTLQIHRSTTTKKYVHVLYTYYSNTSSKPTYIHNVHSVKLATCAALMVLSSLDHRSLPCISARLCPSYAAKASVSMNRSSSACGICTT